LRGTIAAPVQPERHRSAFDTVPDRAAVAPGEKRTRPPHRNFLGLRFCLAGRDAALQLILDECEGPFAYVVTPNAQHVVTMHKRRKELLDIYSNAWLSLCDSQIVRGLAALDGIALPLVRGSDLVAALLADQNSRSTDAGRKRILVVGPDAATERALRERYRKLIIRVLPAPHGLAQRADLRRDIARRCVERQWDILLLCVGSPAQEMIAALIEEFGRRSGVALCVGASIDFVTGRRKRAPHWMQRLGLEWAYRLANEPARLWRRYLVESPKILWIFLNARRAPPD
jgi:N-acetylglucosaminyldiphosphoundecaprenol N-acetyl-beta-D-mannosaminyltransferase